MPGRYVPTMTPDQQRWVILDLELGGYCTLPDKEDPSSLLPLEWSAREGAENWLSLCYRHWRVWEASNHPKSRTVPLRWRPLPDRRSPWEEDPSLDRDVDARWL